MTDHNSPTKPSLTDLQGRFASMNASERSAIDPALRSLIDGLANDREAIQNLSGVATSNGRTQRLEDLERDMRAEAVRLGASTIESDRALAKTLLDHCDHVVPSLPRNPGEYEQDEGGPRP